MKWEQRRCRCCDRCVVKPLLTEFPIFLRTQLMMIPIEEKMREDKLYWFGHMQRHPLGDVKRYIMIFCQCIKKEYGRPKKIWESWS